MGRSLAAVVIADVQLDAVLSSADRLERASPSAVVQYWRKPGSAMGLQLQSSVLRSHTG